MFPKTSKTFKVCLKSPTLFQKLFKNISPVHFILAYLGAVWRLGNTCISVCSGILQIREHSYISVFGVFWRLDPYWVIKKLFIDNMRILVRMVLK